MIQHVRTEVKEMVTATHGFQELAKIARRRAEDVLLLEGMIKVSENALKVPVQLVDDNILKVEYRENVRMALEAGKLSALVGVRVEEFELRKY